MRVNEITIETLEAFLRVPDDGTFGMLLDAAKSFVRSYTGLTFSEMNQYHDLTAAVCILVGEMYDNRVYTVNTDKVNPACKQILEAHCRINL